MECLGPECAAMLLGWLKARAAGAEKGPPPRQSLLWAAAPYQEEAPTIRDEAELAGAFEHLEYALFRRYHNQLTRADRARLDNSIRNALFKVDRFLERLDDGPARQQVEGRRQALRQAMLDGQGRSERLQRQARTAEQKLAQLGSLSPEGFEDFVAELF